MTNMEDMNKKLTEAERQQMVYDRAMASLKAEDDRRVQQGYAMMATATGYGDGRLDRGVSGAVVHVARLFVIGFLCAVPPFLAWYVLF